MQGADCRVDQVEYSQRCSLKWQNFQSQVHGLTHMQFPGHAKLTPPRDLKSLWYSELRSANKKGRLLRRCFK